MTTFLVAAGIVVGLVVLALAGLGAYVLFGPAPAEPALSPQREAERQISDISRRTQEAMIAEALRRAQSETGGRR